MMLTRRRFLRATGGAALAGAGFGAYVWRIEPHWIEVVERDLPLDGLPSRMDGQRLVHLSDLHVGTLVDDGYLRRALERVNALQPRIIAITGDFMTCRADEHIDHALEIVGTLRTRDASVVACLGNHDHAAGWLQPAVARRLCDGLTQLGVQVLRNQTVEIDGLTIGGVDDWWAAPADLSAVVPTLSAAASRLMLCHNPDGVDAPGGSGYRGWILSGHTHGGQIDPPWFAPPRLPVLNRRYTAGAFDLFDGRRLYINRGLGYVRRDRFNCRPEITCFTMRRSDGSAA